jgi:hypothetical protein
MLFNFFLGNNLHYIGRRCKQAVLDTTILLSMYQPFPWILPLIGRRCKETVLTLTILLVKCFR